MSSSPTQWELDHAHLLYFPPQGSNQTLFRCYIKALWNKTPTQFSQTWLYPMTAHSAPKEEDIIDVR